MLSVDEAARRLGVKPETLYAYVSRGMLTRHRAPDGRRSLFDRAEIERLASRSRRGGRAAGLEVIVDTELTYIDPAGALYYRGHDAAILAREATYEEVAELLWGGARERADATGPQRESPSGDAATAPGRDEPRGDAAAMPRRESPPTAAASAAPGREWPPGEAATAPKRESPPGAAASAAPGREWPPGEAETAPDRESPSGDAATAPGRESPLAEAAASSPGSPSGDVAAAAGVRGASAWRVSGGGAVAVADAVVAPSARLVDRIRVIVALAAAADPLRNDVRPAAVRHAARGLIAAMVDGLPGLSAPVDATIAGRLWSRVSSEAPTDERLRVLNAALVLLADHELAISALAARVAASAWADPYLVVLAGLSALGGPLHGGAPGAVERLLAGMREPRDAVTVLGERLAAGEPLPGFGHKVYRGPDPRATTLLELLREAAPDRLPVIEEVLSLVTRHDGPQPNVDLALGALCHAFGLVPGAAEAIFAVARTAGFIAHALEEYPHRLRFRTRAAYTGPQPE